MALDANEICRLATCGAFTMLANPCQATVYTMFPQSINPSVVRTTDHEMSRQVSIEGSLDAAILGNRLDDLLVFCEPDFRETGHTK